MSKTIPNDRFFSTEHEWAKLNGHHAVIGISDHAQASLGDVVYVELPAVGTSIKKGAPIGVIESVKAVSDIYAPLSGEVTKTNQAVLDNPEKINQRPYDEQRLLEITMTAPSETTSLLSPESYNELLAKEAKRH